MAGTVTVVYPDKSFKVGAIVVSWTSDASGDADGTVTLDGAIVRVATNPDGTDVPTDNYDITLVDADSIDILATEGNNRDTSTSEQVFPTDTPFHQGDITFTVANAGNAKKGVCTLYTAWG